MTFIDKLKAHVCGLIRIKTGLYWYDGIRYGADGIPGRVCLLLDAYDEPFNFPGADHAAEALPGTADAAWPSAAVLLFIDGMSKWILVWPDAVELVDAQDNPDGSQKIF